MKKRIVILMFYSYSFLSLFGQSTFSKTYESPRKQYRSVEGVATNVLSLNNGNALFGSVAWSLDTPYYYAYTFINKIDVNGDLIWNKPIGDSVGGTYPEIISRFNEHQFIVAGAKYNMDRTRRTYWYSIYDEDFNEISSHEYLSDLDTPLFWRMIRKRNGDLVFCGVNVQTDNRGNGASDFSKASIMCVDSNGNQKWYHEYWDSTQRHDLHSFNNLEDDSIGNVYVCGQRKRTNVNHDGIVAKFDSDGKLVWYEQVPSVNFSDRFEFIHNLPNGNLILIGPSYQPNISLPSICYMHLLSMDSDGNVLDEKRIAKTSVIDIRNCVTTKDGNIVCGGGTITTEGGIGKGWISKVTPDGQLLWSHVIEKVKNDDEHFFNLSTAVDGGYYLGGISWLPDIYESRNWVVKTDSLGCDTSYCKDTRVVDIGNHLHIFSIFPNPVLDLFTIYLNDEGKSNKTFKLQCYDQNGRRVLARNISGMKNVIDVSTLSSGMYFYTIHDGKRIVQNGKLVKMSEL